MGVAIPIPRAGDSSDAQRRLERLRALAWFLDRSIPVGRWRVGVDPILGLLPGIGDWLGAVLSLYIIYEGARLGTPAAAIARMGGNVLLETLAGAIPILGDLFDFAWQANHRNFAIIEQHAQPGRRPRSTRKIWLMLALVVLLTLGLLIGFAILIARLIAAAAG